MNQLNVPEIKVLAKTNPTSEAIFNALSKRQRSRHRINLRKFHYDLLAGGQRIDEEEYLETFKKLQDLGVGKIVSGRHGNATRFVWHYKLKDIANAVASDTDQVIGEFIPTKEEVTTKKSRKRRTPKAESKVETSPISITFNLSSNTRGEDLAALISLAKELERK